MHLTPCVFAALAGLLLQACSVHDYPFEPPWRAPELLPAEIKARFEYALVTSATLTESWRDSEVIISQGSLTIEVPVGLEDPSRPGEFPVEFEYWRSLSPQGPAPLVLVTPILGGGKELARANCRDFARAGMHVILAWRGTRVLRRGWSVEQLERFLRAAIAGRRALVDWGTSLPEVDPGRVAAFGISMGGVVTSVFAAVEPRLHSAVVALAGGDIPGIVRVSSEGRLVKFREQKQQELGIGPAELEERMRSALPSDPQKLAAYVDPQRVLMITTRYDDVVPPIFQERLWEAMGRPQRYDVPTGHYSGIVYLPYITSEIVRWYRRRLMPSCPADE